MGREVEKMLERELGIPMYYADPEREDLRFREKQRYHELRFVVGTRTPFLIVEPYWTGGKPLFIFNLLTGRPTENSPNQTILSDELVQAIIARFKRYHPKGKMFTV
jgi:hypothetical protein